MAYDSKDSNLDSRQLEAQSVISQCNLTTALSDLPGNIAIDNSTLTATVITLSVNEPLKKCFGVKVFNRASGAVVALAAAPSVAVAQKISVTVNGTGLTDVHVEFIYAVA